jgi:hypothetical protein
MIGNRMMQGRGAAATPHRYWRILAADVIWTPYFGNTFFTTLFTVSMYESSDGTGTDLCIGKTASASSYYGGGYEPGKASDSDNINTRWASGAGLAAYQWWSIDLGANNAKDVNSFALYAYNVGVNGYFPKKFSLQYSDDNSNWSTLATVNTTQTANRQVFGNL